MRAVNFILASALVLSVPIVLGGEFEPYQVIIAKKPFGEEPKIPIALATNPAPRPDQLAKEWKMQAIIETPSGVIAGLFSVKTQRSYLMAIGDSEEEVELVDADFEEERALLKKGTEQFWVSMNEAAGGVLATASAQQLAARSGVAAVADRTKIPASVVRKRRAAVRVKEAPKPLLEGEALEKHLKEYQMELIRAGGEKGPVLPIELTKEMDDQLVAEGVLPPQE